MNEIDTTNEAEAANEIEARNEAAMRRILEERARALARPPQAEEAGDTVLLAVLAIGVERYGIDVERVQEIKELAGVTPVPATPAFWRGLVNLRGSLFPLLDLGLYLGLPSADGAGAGTVVVIGSHGLWVGLLVDEVPEIVRLRADAIGAPGAEAPGGRTDVVLGMTADLLCVLDVEGLLADPGLSVQEEIA